jgi:hypothetical protein
MRGMTLARVAAQAEILRWRQMARRQVTRAIMGLIAAIFAIACLAVLHFAAVMALERTQIAPLWCVLIVAGADLLIALLFLIIAARDEPGRIELEALQVRAAAQSQMLEATAWTTLLAPAMRMLGTRKAYGLALAALTARYLSGASRTPRRGG